MRTLLFFLTFVLCFGVSQAQEHKPRKEKIKALKTAYITEKLNLTSNEAEKFWPIYNEAENKRNALRKKMRSFRQQYANSINDMSEEEAKKHLQALDKHHENMYLLQKETKNKLLTVVSAKKVLLLKKAEDEFNRKMLDEFKKRRKGGPRPH